MKRISSPRLRLVAAVLCAAILISLCSCSEDDLIGLITDFISYADAWTDGPESPTDGDTGADPDGTDPQTGSDDTAELTAEPQTSSSHVHSFRINAETEPTCTSPGKLFLECSCGFLKTEEVPPLGHEYEKYRDIPATCDKEGKTRYDCKRCGVSYYEVTSPPLGHSFVLKETVAPTYSAEGYELYECTVCGLTEKRNITPVLSDASTTDRCSMKSYIMSAMPGEYSAEVTDRLLKNVTSTSASGVPSGEYDPSLIYEGLRTAHNYITRNIAFSHGNGRVSVFTFSDSDAAMMRSDFSWAEEAVNSLGISGSTLQREAIEKINAFICSKLRYDYSASQNSDMHKALSSNTGICQVYGQLFQLMCQYCGIECYYVEDKAHDHVYNYVIFSDGTRLYTDVTWNDAATKDHVEVENAGYTAEQIAGFRSKYLLMTYDEFKTAHGW